MAKKIMYSEPEDYIPKSIREELELGEFAPEPETENADDSDDSKDDKNVSSTKKSV